MKKFIRDKIRESLIEERLMDVNDDVDFIYDTYFRKDYEEIEKTGIITDDMFKSFNINTSMLKSPLAVKADKLNPCVISINGGGPSNFYSPSRNLISVGPNKNAISFVLGNGGSIESAISYLTGSQVKTMTNEFNSSSIKGSIHHELVHWVDDTLHNKHITNRINTAQERNSDITKKGLPINADSMEIQAQIHNIQQLKRKYGDIWDSLSFWDMISYSPALSSMTNNFDDGTKKQWVRNIKTRMYREGLLGKNMVN